MYLQRREAGYLFETIYGVYTNELTRRRHMYDVGRCLCRAHAARYEKEFFADLDALGVRPPHCIPRITDHMPQIIAYIERIEDRGFAYAAGADSANRSVYFDVGAFTKAGHRYGKLEPWKVGTVELAAEGESNFGAREKRSDQVPPTVCVLPWYITLRDIYECL